LYLSRGKLNNYRICDRRGTGHEAPAFLAH